MSSFALAKDEQPCGGLRLYLREPFTAFLNKTSGRRPLTSTGRAEKLEALIQHVQDFARIRKAVLPGLPLCPGLPQPSLNSRLTAIVCPALCRALLRGIPWFLDASSNIFCL
jgi:hypothetical protein